MHRYRRGFSKLKELYKTFLKKKKNIYVYMQALSMVVEGQL